MMCLSIQSQFHSTYVDCGMCVDLMSHVAVGPTVTQLLQLALLHPAQARLINGSSHNLHEIAEDR